MNQLLGFGVVWWALGVYLLLVALSHIAWWSRRAYFPNLDFCSDAHDRFHLSRKEKKELADDPKALAAATERFWHSIGIRLLSQVPHELSVGGFFCTLFWPVVVLLNIVLLAQVVGTQVGEGGGTWEVFPLGTYGAIPLITATLYAIGQTGLGIMYGESKDKKRYLALLLLTLAILFEGGLAVYRAWLIRGGTTAAGPNLVDNSLASQFGVVVGAFFGIFFPIVHASLGYVGFPQFVVPVIRYGIRLTGGLLMLAWSAANYVLFAWHPVHPKDYPEWLEQNPEWDPAKVEVIAPDEKARWDDQRRLSANATTLYGDLKLLLEDLPAIPDTVEKTLQNANDLLERWRKVAEGANEELANATKLPVDASSPGSNDNSPARLGPLYRLAKSHERLNQAIKTIRDAEIKLDQDASKGKLVLMDMESCRTDLAKLQHRLEAIRAIAHLGMDAEGLRKGCETSLTSIVSAFDDIPEPPPGHFRYPEYTLLKEKVTGCKTAYEHLKNKWEKNGPIIPPATDLRARRNELDAMAGIKQAYMDAGKSLYETKRIAEERLKRVEGRPRWFYWLADRIA